MGLLEKAAIKPETGTPESQTQKDASLSRLRDFIDSFCAGKGAFHGLVVADAEETGVTRIELLNGRVSHFGASCALPGKNSLVLVPADLDRELFARLFSQSGEVVCQFSADDSSAALDELRPWL